MTSRRLFHFPAWQCRPGAPRTALGRSCRAFALLAICCGTLAAAPQSDRKKAEAELQALKTQIGRISGQVSRDQIERDRLTRELRAAELSVGSAREGLERVRGEHAERAARAYKDINRLALMLLRPGGALFTFSCSGGIDAGLFHKIVAGAGLDGDLTVAES